MKHFELAYILLFLHFIFNTMLCGELKTQKSDRVGCTDGVDYHLLSVHFDEK